jgi:hypothetical protein
MSDQDQVINCKDCPNAFTFTAGEQAFYASQSPPLTPPKRCKECRAKKKAANGGGQPTRQAAPPTQVEPQPYDSRGGGGGRKGGKGAGRGGGGKRRDYDGDDRY